MCRAACVGYPTARRSRSIKNTLAKAEKCQSPAKTTRKEWASEKRPTFHRNSCFHFSTGLFNSHRFGKMAIVKLFRVTKFSCKSCTAFRSCISGTHTQLPSGSGGQPASAKRLLYMGENIFNLHNLALNLNWDCFSRKFSSILQQHEVVLRTG